MGKAVNQFAAIRDMLQVFVGDNDILHSIMNDIIKYAGDILVAHAAYSNNILAIENLSIPNK